MTYAAQHAAIRTRFSTLWATLTPVAWPNMDFTPPDNGSWARFTIKDAMAWNASCGDPGNNLQRHVGSVIIELYVLSGTGDGPALALIDTAISIFNGYEIPGLVFREVPFCRQIGIDNRWYHTNVIAPFERDSFG